MEERPSRGRGGSRRRGARAGSDSDRFGGEHRGRGRGAHHRSRGKRDHYRGRGRGGGGHAEEFHGRDEGGGDCFEEEENVAEVFSRRKLESNWERYEESEKQEPEDDTPARRGADYRVLLESAGDAFAQFRFSEEKDWELDSLAAGQLCAELVDVQALAEILQQVPLPQRLNLEAELALVSTPVELPTATTAPKREILKTFTGPSAATKGLSTNPQVSSEAAEPPLDDEELDQLLRLQKPVTSASDNQPADDSTAPGKVAVCDDTAVPSPKPGLVRQELTQDDLEDWLDSMIC